ncbi:ADP-heptose--LPS-heptosyltransferase II [Escherichia coli]|uniref:ADP-heptose--LPS-heptosyltransferase II n=1 Tax=Escherichia coli TaxID=562 RepID=A0A376KK85_ECOLX|nr:ADP-heptose--LPS-heptosyltransferase II [Escherichia coli]
MKILVIGPSWVGDMMMSQSLYRTLQARYPPGDNRCDGTGMVPSIIIADAGS